MPAPNATPEPPYPQRNTASTTAMQPMAVTLPRHILYSPEGQMLFIRTGSMTAPQIRDVSAERSADWKAFKETGKLARWMRR